MATGEPEMPYRKKEYYPMSIPQFDNETAYEYGYDQIDFQRWFAGKAEEYKDDPVYIAEGLLIDKLEKKANRINLMKKVIVLLALCGLAFWSMGCAGTQDKALILSGEFNIDLKGGGFAELEIDSKNATFATFPSRTKAGEEIYDLSDAAEMLKALKANQPEEN